MWQRIQTVYLVLAIIACVVCMCLPIANIVPEELAASSAVYNLCVLAPDGSWDFNEFNALASVFMLAVCTDGAIAIFTYKKRKVQATFCLSAIGAIIIWAAIWCVYGFSGMVEITGDFKPAFAAGLPIVAIILFFLARKAILKDEALVRSMDRIR